MDLVKLLNYLDYECEADKRDAFCKALDQNVQDALDELWEKYYAVPKNNGHWTGEPCNSV